MKQLLRGTLLLLSLIIFILPGYVYFITNNGGEQLLNSQTPSIGMLTLSRLFGLYAFVLVWSQLMMGSLRIPLQKLFGSKILKLHLFFGPFTLILAFTHYFMFTLANLLVGLDPIKGITSYLGPNVLYGYLGIAAFYLMVLTVITAMLRTRPFLQKHWRKIHYINYLIFLLAFIHSYTIGSDVTSSLMRLLYLFFGITYIVAFFYQWGYRKVIKK